MLLDSASRIVIILWSSLYKDAILTGLVILNGLKNLQKKKQKKEPSSIDVTVVLNFVYQIKYRCSIQVLPPGTIALWGYLPPILEMHNECVSIKVNIIKNDFFTHPPPGRRVVKRDIRFYSSAWAPACRGRHPRGSVIILSGTTSTQSPKATNAQTPTLPTSIWRCSWTSHVVGVIMRTVPRFSSKKSPNAHYYDRGRELLLVYEALSESYIIIRAVVYTLMCPVFFIVATTNS